MCTSSRLWSTYFVLMFFPWTNAWKVGAPLALYRSVICVWKTAAGKSAKTSLDVLCGGVFVFSCCVANHKCSSLKEHTVVWVRVWVHPHSLGTLPRSGQVETQRLIRSGYTEAPSGCCYNLPPGCRTEVPVFLLVVSVGNSFDSFIGLLYFLPHGSLLVPSLQ